MTRILIADDNDRNLYLLETLLKGKGYEVVSARNGVEALARALENPPDLIVTDILMPEMDGFELCRRWRANELLRRIPFVFYTATYTDLKDEQFALSLGADRFLTKPQQPETLVQIVQEMLSRPRKEHHVPRKKSGASETKVLQQYNDVLFRKLEKKVSQLEEEMAKQQKTENELRQSERKYRTLVAQSPDGIYVVDLKGNFLAVNTAMCLSLKYSEDELLSMSIWDIVPEQYRDVHDQRMADISMGKAPSTAAEYMAKGKDGTLRYVEIRSAPYYEGTRVVGLQGIARDITDRKQAEERLEKSYERLKKTLNDAINMMVKIVEMRDPYTAGHQHKVAELATALAKEMGCGDDQIDQLRMAAIVHDIGKIDVPSEILSKPGKLTQIEYDLIKSHSQHGFEIVEGMDFPGAVAQAVRQHHERLDGSGYPDGLRGDEISPEAKILAVADVVEAMASHRPYRPALGIDKALEEIRNSKGRLYDPDVVSACVNLFERKGFRFTE